MTKKTAVVLFNLGGPDNPDAVQPFLFNLFYDPAIITVPNPFRLLLAKLISKKRAPLAKEIYQHLGGGSPILPLTQKQADALEKKLQGNHPDKEFKTFIAMRYWHPFTEETVKQVKEFAPDSIILLPLYPQFSTTTSGSSLKKWQSEAKKQGINAKTYTIGCYPIEPHFITAQTELIREYYTKAQAYGAPRILFSAHGLPKKIVEKGDPYQWQVEQTAAAIVEKLAIGSLDWTVCYQSRVGPLEWIGPSTEEEIKRGGKDKIPLVIVPIAFVSEHSETLVELDIEYKKLADNQGVSGYFRVPALGEQDGFIDSLATMCRNTFEKQNHCTSFKGERLCPQAFSQCICE